MNKKEFNELCNLNPNPIIWLNEICNPNYMQITAVTDRLLPYIDTSSVNIRKRVGQIPTSSDVGIREITINFTIDADSEETMRQRARALANFFLYHTEDVKYINAREPNGYYTVRIQDGGELRERVMLGDCKIVLVAHDPHFYKNKDIELSFVESAAEYGPIEIINEGQSTFPTIRFEATKLHSELFIITANRFMQFGSGDHGLPVVPSVVPVISEQLVSLASWSHATSIYDGRVEGQIAATANGFVQQGNNFGSNIAGDARWRGSGVRRPLQRSLRNWRINSQFEFHVPRNPLSTPPEPPSMGRVMITALNVQGELIASVRFENRYAMFFPHFMVGTHVIPSGAHARDIVDYRTGLWANPPINENTIAGSRRFDFVLERIGGRFFASVRRHCPLGIQDPTLISGTLNFNLEGSQLDNLAQIQIDITTRSNAGIVNMAVHRIDVLEIPELHEATPSILNPGDIVEVNSETGSILRNGERWFEDLAPNSQFPILSSGSNQIIFSPSDGVANVNLRAKNRFL